MSVKASDMKRGSTQACDHGRNSGQGVYFGGTCVGHMGISWSIGQILGKFLAADKNGTESVCGVGEQNAEEWGGRIPIIHDH